MSTSQKTKGALLPDDVLWADGGHASDVVLTALADGQVAIVPPSVLMHVERCTTCTMHLGNAALLSLHAGAELAALAEARAEATARRPLPRLAIGLGLAVAFLGLLPTVFDAPSAASGARAFATHDVPLVVRGLSTLVHRLFEPGSSVGLVLTYGTALLLVAMGFAVVRLLPQKERSQ
jgi:hypothetical protein